MSVRPVITANKSGDIFIDAMGRLDLAYGNEAIMQNVYQTLNDPAFWMNPDNGLFGIQDKALVNETIKARVLAIDGIKGFVNEPTVNFDRNSGILTWDGMCVKLDCGVEIVV